VFNLQLVIRLLHIRPTKNIQSDTESDDLQVKMYAYMNRKRELAAYCPWQSRLNCAWSLITNIVSLHNAHTHVLDTLGNCYLQSTATFLRILSLHLHYSLDMLLLQFGIPSHSTSDIHLLLVPLNVI